MLSGVIQLCTECEAFTIRLDTRQHRERRDAGKISTLCFRADIFGEGVSFEGKRTNLANIHTALDFKAFKARILARKLEHIQTIFFFARFRFKDIIRIVRIEGIDREEMSVFAVAEGGFDACGCFLAKRRVAKLKLLSGEVRAVREELLGCWGALCAEHCTAKTNSIRQMQITAC